MSSNGEREAGFVGRYIHDDTRLRDLFDHQLAEYLRSHKERWDITAIVEALDLVGGRVGDVRVQLCRQPTGRLSVTIGFDLEPLHLSR